MKKSTYAIIGLLAFVFIATIAATCIIISTANSGGVKIDKSKTIEKTIDVTGKIHDFYTEDFNRISFSNQNGDYYDDAHLYIDVVFDPEATQPVVYMDELWYKKMRKEAENYGKWTLNVVNTDNQRYNNISVEKAGTKRGKDEYRAYYVKCKYTSAARVYATIVLPTTLGTLTGIEANDFNIRVYGSVTSGLKLEGNNLTFCDNYDYSKIKKPTKQ